MRALTVLILLLPVLGACHRHAPRANECSANSPYVHARAVPVLHAADGLPAPNTHNSLKIPDEVAAAKPHVPGTACLDEPPSFYADRPKPAPAKK